MKRITLLRWIPAAACAVGAVWIASAQQPKRESRVDNNGLKNAAKSGDEWITYGRDYSETRFSPLKQIDATNVQRLGLTKVLLLKALGAMEATPLVHDGIMYASHSYGIVFAYDLHTGEKIWEYDPKVSYEAQQHGCCGVVNRGVALYQGRVYVGAMD